MSKKKQIAIAVFTLLVGVMVGVLLYAPQPQAEAASLVKYAPDNAWLRANAKTVEVDISTATTTTVIAADSTKTRMIWGIELQGQAGGSQTVIFNDGTTAINGVWSLASGGTYSKGLNNAPFLLTHGNAFTITTSAAETCRGTVIYSEWTQN